MRAGALKYRLTLLEPQRVTDRMGAERVEYIETRTVRAERVRTTGNRSEEVGEHFPAYSAEFNIRDAHKVQENWRVRQVGGYLYAVVSIVPNLDKGYKTLLCDRVNE